MLSLMIIKTKIQMNFLVVLLSAAFATEYFAYPSLVAHFNPHLNAYNITFSGALSTSQCEHDQINCLGAVVILEAKFQTYPSESTFYFNNALPMCDANGILPPEYSQYTHLGVSGCGTSNFYGQMDVAFTIPVVQPSAQIKSLVITVSIAADSNTNPSDYDNLYEQELSLLNKMLLKEEEKPLITKL